MSAHRQYPRLLSVLLGVLVLGVVLGACGSIRTAPQHSSSSRRQHQGASNPGAAAPSAPQPVLGPPASSVPSPPPTPVLVPAGAPALLSPAQALQEAVGLVDAASPGTPVDLEVYELGYTPLIQALEAAKHRGAAVRVIVDATENQSTTSAPVLQAAGVPVERAQVPGGIDHVKLLVTQRAVLTGGVNDGRYSADTVDLDFLFTTPSLVQEAQSIFETDWSAAGSGAPLPSESSGPFLVGRAIEPALLARISALGAGWSCYGAENYLSDYTVRDALERAAAQGAKVRIVLNPETSEASSTFAALAHSALQVEHAPSEPYLHAKVLVCEGPGGTAWAFGGSANLSYEGMSVNHELDVELTGSAAQAVYQWAEGIWSADG